MLPVWSVWEGRWPTEVGPLDLHSLVIGRKEGEGDRHILEGGRSNLELQKKKIHSKCRWKEKAALWEGLP